MTEKAISLLRQAIQAEIFLAICKLENLSTRREREEADNLWLDIYKEVDNESRT